MRLFSILGGIFAIALTASPVLADVGCLPNADFETVDFSGEVYGAHGYMMESGFRRLSLSKIDTGWEIEIVRSDQSQVPVRMRPIGQDPRNSLQIVGQDFRNLQNTQSVSGSRIRKFMFGRDSVDPALSPELAGPSPATDDPPNIAAVEPTEGELGIGELIIEDIGLSTLGPTLTPRLNYLKFSGCLGWHQGYQGPAWRMESDPAVPDVTISVMKQCGFDHKTYRLSDHTTQWSERGAEAYLEADLTGDGIKDFLAPVTRRQDQAHGLALCRRSDNRVTMLGFDPQSRDVGTFSKQGDYWTVHRAPLKPGSVIPRPMGEGVVFGLSRGPEIFVFIDETNAVQIQRRNTETDIP